MKRWRSIHAVFVLIFIAPLLALAQDATKPVSAEPRYFQFQRTVTVTNAPQACAPLDASVFAHAAPSLGDLRLYAGSREVPYAMHTAFPLSTTPAAQPALFNLGQSGARITFDADMKSAGTTPSYSDLELQVTATNFIATVTVSGSQSSAGSATRLGTYTIFDLTGQRLGRSTILHLPDSNFPWLHFDLSGPLKAENITGLIIPQLPTREERFTLVAQAGPAAQQGRSTVFTVDLPANVPVTRIEFLPPDVPVNFSRSVTVQAIRTGKASPDEEQFPPSTLARNVSRIHMLHNGDRIDDESLSLETESLSAAPTSRRLTITIDNGDDPPIAWMAVRFEMRQASLCFDAAAGAQPYTLMYSDSALSAPHYDYAALFQPEDKPAAATLEPEQPNPAYQPRPDQRPFTEQHPAILWIALVLVVVALAAVALRSGKRLQSK